MEFTIRESGELQAPAIVFLHGGGVGGWMWDKQLEAFKDYHLLVPDLPAHGQNARIPFVSMQHAAETIMSAVSDRIGMEKMILVGFSLGAQLAVEMASRWPDRVDTAVFISPLLKPLKGRKMLLAILKLSFGLVKNKTFAKLQAKSTHIPVTWFERYYQDSLLIQKEDFVTMMDANMSYGVPQGFESTDARCLVLVGGRERKMMRESAAEMVHKNRNCSGFVVAGMPHGLPYFDADTMNGILSHFINNIQLHRQKKLKRIV